MSNTAVKRERFQRLSSQIAELVVKTNDQTAHRATAAAILHHKVPGVSWTGFYLVKGGDLVVDAYQGPVACLVLPANTGVCWAAINRRESVLVKDVESFPGHIACDAQSRSEVVIPICDPDGRPIGVLDVDSHRPAHFDDADVEGYAAVVRLLEQTWWPAGR